MTVTVHFTDGKRETFRRVRDVQNQTGEYRLPSEEKNGTTILVPKHTVKWLEFQS
jgi:hypothetical protein